MKKIETSVKSTSSIWTMAKCLLVLPALMAVVSIHSANSALTNSAWDSKHEMAISLMNPFQIQDQLTQNPNSGKPISNYNSDRDTSVFKVVEHMPSYPGGNEALYEFLSKNINYPVEALKKGISGRVFVTFIVRKDGKVTDVEVLRGIGGGCDEEAVRVVKLMPKWEPGIEKGKPVDVQFNLPIKFAFDKDKSK